MSEPTRGLPVSEAVDLAGLVEVSSGGIVSRQLTRAAGGNLTLFAFDAGQELSEHTSPFDALVVILEGRAELVIGGASVFAGPGQAVLMPADVPHAVKAPEPFKMLLGMVRG